MPLHPLLVDVTTRIQARSRPLREAYLQQLQTFAGRAPGALRLGCANVAHAFAAMPEDDKRKASGLGGIALVQERSLNIGIVNAYNDMLSAHAPLQHYPDLIKDEARLQGATAQVAGGAAMLKAWAGPFFDVKFCPTGGVTPTNAAEFLALPNVACVGGSWLVPADALAQGDWTRIEALAREAAQMARPHMKS